MNRAWVVPSGSSLIVIRCGCGPAFVTFQTCCPDGIESSSQMKAKSSITMSTPAVRAGDVGGMPLFSVTVNDAAGKGAG